MTDTAIRQDLDADGILLLTIDVPGQSDERHHAGSVARPRAAIERLKTDAAVKGAVLTSGKASGFMAGADLKGMGALFGRAARQCRTASRRWPSCSTASSRSTSCSATSKPAASRWPPPSTAWRSAAVSNSSLACHYRVIADNPKITLGLPEVMVGLFPGAGGTQRLPRLMGAQPALMYLLQGKNMSPQEALGFGVVQAVVAGRPGGRRPPRTGSRPTRRKGVQPWDEKNFRFPGGVGAMNPAFAQTFMGGTAMTHVNSRRNMNAPKAILSAVYEGAQLPMDTAIRVEIASISPRSSPTRRPAT